MKTIVETSGNTFILTIYDRIADHDANGKIVYVNKEKGTAMHYNHVSTVEFYRHDAHGRVTHIQFDGREILKLAKEIESIQQPTFEKEVEH